VRNLGGVLALHTMRFHDEIVHADDLDTPRAGKAPTKREVQMAGQLVESLHRKFKPEDYEDTYREAVLELITRKAKGEELAPPEPEPEEEPDDLAAALQASLGAR
jgi:DNA end-binding protein Ku